MKTFEELGVSDEICRAISEMGFVSPMPVQEQVIPYLLSGDSDVVALAQTGTGKTAAFGLPILQKLDIDKVEPQSLILSPTRELCLQIAEDLRDFSKYIDGVRVLPVYGGSSIESQIKALKRGVHVIVATPGRLLDLMKRKTVSLSTIKNVVMDEADEMLDMGFSEDLNAILSDVPEDRTTLMFSATMSKEIEKIAKNYLHNAKEITIGRKNEGTHSVRHVAYCVHAKDKYETLKRIVDYYPNIYGIVFCRTRAETQEIADKLMQDGYNADSLHGELSQAQRDLVMQKFRVRHIQLLVATDVAARGLDVDDLTHVINYGLPDDTEYYTHRSGRTGRAGKTGTSIAIINLREKGKMRQIEKAIGQQFQMEELPTGKEICKKQLMKTIDNIEKVKVNEEEIADFMPEVFRKLEWLDKEDIIKRVVSLEFNHFLDYYLDHKDIELAKEGRDSDRRGSRDGERRGERRDRRGDRGGRRDAEPGYTRLFINLGKLDNLKPRELMDMINHNVKQHVEVGRIDLMSKFSFFEVNQESANSVAKFMSGIQFGDRKVQVEIADESGAGNSKPDFSKNNRGGRDSEPSRGGRNGKRGEGKRERRNSDSKRTDRENKEYSKARGHNKDDWKQFFEGNDSKAGFDADGWNDKPKKGKKK